ncbi:MAG: redox-regulated ATPase YchF [Eubacteriaceae bacterium]|nr:redox-regulated ATPase YchF [Eubacteriaceae bacterium]
MKIGLIGLNQTGKTTLFNLLTGNADDMQAKSAKGSANTGVGIVPDQRIDFLSALFKPRKTINARIELVDVAGFSVSGQDKSSGAAKFLDDVRNCEALVHVLRAFDSNSVVHDLSSVNPVRDLELVETELVFADLEFVDKRISRIKEGKKITKEQTDDLVLLERCFEWLEDGGTMREMGLTAEERQALQHYSFLTDKPRLVVVNLDDNQWSSKEWPMKEELQVAASSQNIPVLEICAEMELEISQLEEEDKKLFMQDMGFEVPGVSMLAYALYRLLGQISFFTVGEDEVRAWTIDEGTVAKHAAGKIHSDIERGFIRAEVVKYDNLRELGSMAKVKEKGLFKLEGKEYLISDGDIINFRFNV